MQDIRPINDRPIRPQPRPLAPAARRMPMQSSVGGVVEFVRPIKYSDFGTPIAEPAVDIGLEIDNQLTQETNNYIPLNEVAENVQQINENPEKPPKHGFRRFITRRNVLSGVIILALVVAAYLGINNWSTVKPLLDPVSAGAVTQYSTAEGSDETELPQNTLTDYKVAADFPRALYINKIDVSARVLPMGVNVNGNMQAPIGIYDSGWYTGSSKPGEAGAMLIDGHASGPTREGLFANLDSLQQGDSIELEKGDGEKLSYKVVFTETVALKNVDMGKMLLPYGDNTQGLNLITCTGKWLKDKQTYDQRVTVYATRVE